MSKTLFNKIIVYAVVIFLLILMPSEINLPNQSTIQAICTGLAIDVDQNNPDGLSVTSQIVIPQAGGQYKQSVTIVTTEGKNLLDALNKMDYQIGKKLRLSHCCYVIIGYQASLNDLSKTLDYLVRGNNTGNNIVLVHTTGLARDLIEGTTSVNTNEVDNLQTITKYNDEYLASNDANLKSFFDDYMSPHSTSVINCINRTKSQSSGDSSNSGGSGSSNSSGSNSGSSIDSQAIEKDTIKNNGEISIFKKGKLVMVLDNEMRKKFNWLDDGLRETSVVLEHIDSEIFDDATIGFTLLDKELKSDFSIQNNQPTVHLTLNVRLRTEMILQDNGEVLPNKTYNDEVIAHAFNELANKDINEVIALEQEYGFDVFNYYHEFEMADYQGWQKYLNSLDDPEDYMKNIQVFIKVNTDVYGISSIIKSFK